MPSERHKRKILVVEDDAAIGAALVKFLQKNDYAPTLCENGDDALSASRGVTFDAVITDVHLPDINGLILSQKLREYFGPAMPIIVLSGDTSTEVLKSLSHVGATYFFSKPASLEVLRDHLAQYFTPVGKK